MAKNLIIDCQNGGHHLEYQYNGIKSEIIIYDYFLSIIFILLHIMFI